MFKTIIKMGEISSPNIFFVRSQPYQHQSYRMLSAFKKRQRAKIMETRQQQQSRTTTSEEEPAQSQQPADFALLLRQLYKRGHPDLLRHSHPELSRVNDMSMQLLNGVLSSIKVPNEYPPRTIQDIPFHLKHPVSGVYEEHTLSIRTAGGDCQKQLTQSFEVFFASTGLSEGGKFVWNKEYFPLPESGIEDNLNNL